MNPAHIERQDWITLGSNGSLDPVFFLPGVGGDPEIFRTLAERLDGERHGYGFRYPGGDAEESPIASVSDIAQRFRLQIEDLHPQRPVHLCGYSFGALVAFELACQLAQLGKPVGLLALLDAQVPGSMKPRPPIDRLAIHLKHLASAAGRREIAQRITSLLGPGHAAATTPEAAGDVSPGTRALFEASKRAIAAYAPSNYAGPVTVLAAEPQPWMDFTISHPTYGWDALAGSVDFRRIPGRHLQIFENENVSELARALNQPLARAEAES